MAKSIKIRKKQSLHVRTRGGKKYYAGKGGKKFPKPHEASMKHGKIGKRSFYQGFDVTDELAKKSKRKLKK